MTSGLDRIRKEIPKLTKFVIVGSTTFLLQTFLYYVFSRWLVSYLPRTMTYFLAVVYSLVYNYSLNRAWTFNRHAAAKGSVKRYAIVAVVASVISSILFWTGHDWLHFYDLYVVVGVNLLVPLYTFVAHRQYTFRNVV